MAQALPAPAPPGGPPRWAAARRAALSYYVTAGVCAAFGLLLISAGIHAAFGRLAATAALIGVVVCIPPDQAGPRRGKLSSLLPAALIGLPLFFAVQLLRDDALQLGLLLVPATFLAFLAGAWGARGAPLVMSIMFSLLFSMAIPAADGGPFESAAFFALGSALYLAYAVAANALLNGRYRVQMLADTLFDVAELMRAQAERFDLASSSRAQREPLIGRLIAGQAALADHLQLARNLLLESPRSGRRCQLAAMFLHVLEMRDHLLASALDLDIVRAHPAQAATLAGLRAVLLELAAQAEAVGDALLGGDLPPRLPSLRARLGALDDGVDDEPGDAHAPSAGALARGLAKRIAHLSDELVVIAALGRGEAEPDLAAVRVAWQMFVSPSAWSPRPLVRLWHRDAPALRHALRATLAVGAGYALTLVLPWGTHGHWILLAIVGVLRGSLAQTLSRRNSRVAGTFVGCVIASAVLSAGLPHLALLLVVSVSQAFAHAFAMRRYLITSVAATVLSLVQVNLLHAGADPLFDVLERMGNTLIGVGIAWLFSYVLPSWERAQMPALVARALAAQSRHAHEALGLGQLAEVDNEPEISWRLARREAYDSLSALVHATQRALAEPRAVRPPLQPLGRLLAHSYQLLAQLSAIKAMLLSGRGRLDRSQICAPLEGTRAHIEALLGAAQPARRAALDEGERQAAALPLPPPLPSPLLSEALPFADPLSSDLSPWLLRRLQLASEIAAQMRDEAAQVLAELARRERSRAR